MKRLLHRLMLLVLTIALPLYGSAAIVAAPVCKMQMLEVFSGGDSTIHSAHDCCADSHEHKSATDMPCKSGGQCQSNVVFIAAGTTIAVTPHFVQTFAFTSTSFINAPLHTVWRPPLLG